MGATITQGYLDKPIFGIVSAAAEELSATGAAARVSSSEELEEDSASTGAAGAGSVALTGTRAIVLTPRCIYISLTPSAKMDLPSK